MPVEDEHAQRRVAGTDIQDGDAGVAREGEEVAHQLEPLASRPVLGLSPSDPLVDVRLRVPVVVITLLHVTLEPLAPRRRGAAATPLAIVSLSRALGK